MENERKNKNKIVALILLIVTLMVSTTGATYAYFALSGSNNNVISGTTAKVDNVLTVTPVLPASNGTGVMVPQYSTYSSKNTLKSAIDGGCIDGNNNIVCKVYKIDFQNKGNSAIRINSLLTLTSTMTNLKWYILKTENDVASLPANVTYTYPSSLTSVYGNAKTVTTLGDAQILNSNKYRYWYVVIWVEETGNDQYGVDGDRTFNGEVTIQAIDAAGNALQGITSTFRS